MRITIAVLISLVAVLLQISTAGAESGNLITRTGNSIGLSLSYYKYEEPGYMSLTGPKLGLNIQSTYVLPNEIFLRGDFRYAFGSVDYQSQRTGSAFGEPDWYIEVRELIGKDGSMGGSIFTTYAGLGYRYLFNDAQGLSCVGSVCYFGYRRESNYLYIPVGIVHRMALKGQSRLSSTLEYDHLLLGIQNSRLSDGTTAGYSDAKNYQSSGFGLKLSIIFEKGSWAIGPYAHYWNIEQSESVPEIRFGIPTGRLLAEPKNNTVEFGLKVSQQF